MNLNGVILAIVLLPVWANAASKLTSVADQPTNKAPVVTLCDLLTNPGQYAGKTVVLKAIFSSGMHFAILIDDACQPRPEKTELVWAVFSNKYEIEVAANKKWISLLKRKHQAYVNVEGVFIDPGGNIGHQFCCRYKFEIRHLMTFEEVRTKS